MAAATQPVHNSIKPGKWVKSTCKMCLHSCTSRIHITDDGIVNKIEGDPSNPSNNGKLCPKGNSAILRHYDPNRFKQPLKRTNPVKGVGIDPGWVPISWEEAYGIVARELKQSIDQDPRKLMCSIEDFHKMNTWIWALSFGNNNCFNSNGTMCGGAYHPANGYIHSTFAAANDAKHCNYWINNGTGDGFSSHLHAAAQSNWVAKARMERGMRIVTVEPRLSISGAKSEEWIPIRPATDRQFALGLCQVLVDEGLCDYEFLKKDTNAPYLTGEDGYFVRNAEGKIYVWDAVANCAKLWDDPSIGDFALLGSYTVEGKSCKPAFQRFRDTLDAECTPEKTEVHTTVPAATIRRIAREFAKAAQIGATIEIDGRTMPLRPAAYNYYRGAQGRKMGMQANHAYKMVNMLIGAIDTPGGHMGVTLDDKWEDFNHIVPGENGQIEGISHQLGMVPPFSYPSNEFHLFSHFPVGVHPPHLNLEVFLNKGKYGIEYDPDVMLVCHSNPLWAMQGPRDKWFEFMKSMRFIVAIDIIPTETTDFADVILPTTDALESWNMTMIEPPHTEGMCLRQPATEPLYDVKSEEEIFYELSERLGVLGSYNDMVNMICGFDHNPNLMLERDKKYTDKEIARRKGLLWNGKDLDWYIERGHAVTERRPDKWYRPWQGLRLLFYIEDLLVQRDTLKAKMEELDVPYRHDWQWDDYSPLPTARLDPIHTDEPPEYDLYCIFFKDIQLNFGESLTNPWIKDIVYRDPVHTSLLLNTKTAAAKGLNAGDIVRVESPYGRIYGRIGTTEAMHPETLGVSNSLSRLRTTHRNVRHAGGHFNDMLPCNLRHTDAVTGQPDTATRVKITRLEDWPQELKEGKSVYDVVDDVAKGKGAH